MWTEEIEDPEDPRLWPYRLLRDADLVRKSDLFVAEGRLLVRRLLQRRAFDLHSLVLTPSARDALREPGLEVPTDCPCYVVSSAVLRSLGGISFHQGCLAAARRPAEVSLQKFLAGQGDLSLLVGLEEVSNPDNVGTIFRSALALGAGGVVLSPGSASPLYRKALRTSMGAALSLPFCQVRGSFPEALTALRERGYALVALTPEGEPLAQGSEGWSRRSSGPFVLLLGSEGSGLSPAVRNMADTRLAISLSGGVDSLNVAAAAAIALYALGR